MDHQSLSVGRYCGERPHLVHEPSGFSAWFLEPLGVLTQFPPRGHSTGAVARFLADVVTPPLVAASTARGVKPYFMHDWVGLASYDRDARKIMTAWSLKWARLPRRIVLSIDMSNPLVRMGVSVTEMIVASAGISLEVVEDVYPFLMELELLPDPSLLATPSRRESFAASKSRAMTHRNPTTS